MTCYCCYSTAMGGIWHIHKRCPAHGSLQYRGIPAPPGSYYGACLNDHAVIGLHPVPCKLSVTW